MGALVVGAHGMTPAPAQELWKGLQVAPENRCANYRSDDYRTSQRVKDAIIADYGGIYSPYTGEWFETKSQTDIEHIVARSEAHDSGLCSASAGRKRQFAEDLLNLTLASPSVKRHQKVDGDAAEWMPERNECWFADRVVKVRRKYDLTIDRREADALEDVLSGCSFLRNGRVSDVRIDRGSAHSAASSAEAGHEARLRPVQELHRAAPGPSGRCSAGPLRVLRLDGSGRRRLGVRAVNRLGIRSRRPVGKALAGGPAPRARPG